MSSELKGRFADYFNGDKAAGTVKRKVHLSLNAVKMNFGNDIAKEVLKRKRFTLSNGHWFELIPIPGEKSADDVLKEELVKALYLDLKESYPSVTYAWLLAEADKQLAGASPAGGPGMFLHDYLIKIGLLKNPAREGK